MVDGTVVIVDETSMKEGQIKEKGILNIKTLATLIEEQTVSYDFQFHQQEIPINSPVVVLSDGRSMFKNSIHVPTNKDASKVFD